MDKKKGKYSENQYPSQGIESFSIGVKPSRQDFHFVNFSDMPFLVGGRFYEGEGGARDFRFGKGYQKKIRFKSGD